jgi:excisionase family DNA binding protein
MDQAGLAAWYDTCRGLLLSLTVERMLQEQKQTSRRPLQPSASLLTPEQCAEFLGIKINTLYVMKSQGRIPYRKVGHLLRFDFDEIIEWTKDKEK